jgi:hypothetical protein
MTLLASRLANRLGLGLVTESNAADQLALAVRKGKPFSGGNELFRRRRSRHGDFDAFGPRRTLPRDVARGMLLDLMLESISLPKDVPAKKLLSFKRDHAEELGVFRREVAKLVSELPSDLPVEALRQAIHDQYESNVRPALRSLRDSLNAQGWDTALNGFLKVSFLSAAPTSALVLAGLPTSVALLAGAGVSLTASAVMFVNQRRRTQAESPYSYLMSLERQW